MKNIRPPLKRKDKDSFGFSYLFLVLFKFSFFNSFLSFIYITVNIDFLN